MAVMNGGSVRMLFVCTANVCRSPLAEATFRHVVSNAGRAEEFEIDSAGTVRVIDESGEVLMSHEVQAGDIWRMCQTKDLPIRDWV